MKKERMTKNRTMKFLSMVIAFVICLACGVQGFAATAMIQTDGSTQAAEGDLPAWKLAYIAVLQAQGDGYYSVYDIDKDGMPELLWEIGIPEFARYAEVYTFQNGAAQHIGSFQISHSSLYSWPDGNGVAVVYGHMGAFGCWRYELYDNQLTRIELFNYAQADSYDIPYEGVDYIPQSPWSDFSLLTNFQDAGVVSVPGGQNAESAGTTASERTMDISPMVGAGGRHSVLLRPNGRVLAIGGNDDGQMNVDTWTNVTKVKAGILSTVALRSDGTAYATGNNQFGQCDVASWRDLIDIETQHWHTLGLKSDGTVVATGFNAHGQCDVDAWKDVQQISCGEYFSAARFEDGHVEVIGDNTFGQCNTEDWSDMIEIAAGYQHLVGLRPDGTVVATGRNNVGQCNVTGWTDVIHISAGYDHTLGLRSDGTVLIAGNVSFGQGVISDWRNIVQISAGNYTTLALRSDGTVVAAGWNEFGQCNVARWN